MTYKETPYSTRLNTVVIMISKYKAKLKKLEKEREELYEKHCRV
jgi:hypothetical protein